ncbi:MAG: hypothetical protein NXI24_08110 [bacterium]|nr:hypothetical protein [bacterium]
MQAFPLRLLVAMLGVVVLAGAGVEGYGYYNETRDRVFAQLDQQMREVAQAPLFRDEQARAHLKYLVETFEANQEFEDDPEKVEAVYGPDGKAATDDDGYVPALPESLSAKLMAGREFQYLIDRLREIRPGPGGLEQRYYREEARERGEIKPGELELEYIYVLARVGSQPVEKFLSYLVDLDYLPVDENGDGEFDAYNDYEGNPIGNITLPITDEMHLGFSGAAIAEQELSEDMWGDVVVSAFIPILDSDGSVLAVLGLDYNARSAAKQIAEARNMVIIGMVGLTLVVIALCVLVTAFAARKSSRSV